MKIVFDFLKGLHVWLLFYIRQANNSVRTERCFSKLDEDVITIESTNNNYLFFAL